MGSEVKEEKRILRKDVFDKYKVYYNQKGQRMRKVMTSESRASNRADSCLSCA
jgi:hypothetical protein